MKINYYRNIDGIPITNSFHFSELEFLTESYGIMPNMNNYAVPLSTKMCNYIKSQKETSFSKKFIILGKGDVFFKKIIVLLTYELDDTFVVDSGYLPTDFNDNDLTITIEIDIKGPRRIESTDISSILYHEITHAYEDWNLYKKHNISLFDDLNKDYYGLWQYLCSHKQSLIPEAQVYVYLLYCLSHTERNAVISQIEPEIMNFIKEITYSNEAVNRFHDTNVYKHMTDLKRYVNYIENFDKTTDDKILFSINSVLSATDFECKDLNSYPNLSDEEYHKFKNLILIRWIKFQKQFNKNASKIMYNCYSKYSKKPRI